MNAKMNAMNFATNLFNLTNLSHLLISSTAEQSD